jgi:uncharacterized membrane protein YccF (DUF307 family)
VDVCGGAVVLMRRDGTACGPRRARFAWGDRPPPAPLAPAGPTREDAAVRLILNIIWFVLAGVWMALGYALAALICFILIITIPFGIAALRIAVFALWPFGKTVVRRSDAGIASGIGNVLWFVLCGWWLALAHLISGVALCLTIIGIPLGLANFKLIPVSLMPLGREIVDADAVTSGAPRF